MGRSELKGSEQFKFFILSVVKAFSPFLLSLSSEFNRNFPFVLPFNFGRFYCMFLQCKDLLTSIVSFFLSSGSCVSLLRHISLA